MSDGKENIVDFQRARGIAEIEKRYREADAGMYRGEFDHLLDRDENVDPSKLMGDATKEAVPLNNAIDTPVERGVSLAANDNAE
jgi:hypothetical protein